MTKSYMTAQQLEPTHKSELGQAAMTVMLHILNVQLYTPELPNVTPTSAASVPPPTGTLLVQTTRGDQTKLDRSAASDYVDYVTAAGYV